MGISPKPAFRQPGTEFQKIEMIVPVDVSAVCPGHSPADLLRVDIHAIAFDVCHNTLLAIYYAGCHLRPFAEA